MYRRWLLVASFLFAGCGSRWEIIRPGSTNPLLGQTRVIVLPIAWEGAQIDGEPIEKFFAGKGADWSREWPRDRVTANTQFLEGLKGALTSGKVVVATPDDPQGATLSIRPTVTDLATGGFRATVLTLSADVLDAGGKSVEQISTKVSMNYGYAEFEKRLGLVTGSAGANIAEYLQQRTRGP